MVAGVEAADAVEGLRLLTVEQIVEGYERYSVHIDCDVPGDAPTLHQVTRTQCKFLVAGATNEDKKNEGEETGYDSDYKFMQVEAPYKDDPERRSKQDAHREDSRVPQTVDRIAPKEGRRRHIAVRLRVDRRMPKGW